MNTLQNYRDQIDAIDNKLLELFEKRFKLVKKIGKYKKGQGLPVVDKQRENQKLETLVQKGIEHNISYNFIKNVWTAIFNQSYIIEQ